jgi:hypothetical protein
MLKGFRRENIDIKILDVVFQLKRLPGNCLDVAHCLLVTREIMDQAEHQETRQQPEQDDPGHQEKKR